eukprot:TRINITY_DN23347_c0_g1_i1.p1 TRINITY_DN23347_c0_g1~~TRINITY_DN23347_c0_g1_i1.p1  ORF type:complete len:220 (-),score=29.40 TRINITY_DN23347_c0_g1_i1:25-642(-)
MASLGARRPVGIMRRTTTWRWLLATLAGYAACFALDLGSSAFVSQRSFSSAPLRCLHTALQAQAKPNVRVQRRREMKNQTPKVVDARIPKASSSPARDPWARKQVSQSSDDEARNSVWEYVRKTDEEALSTGAFMETTAGKLVQIGAGIFVVGCILWEIYLNTAFPRQGPRFNPFVNTTESVDELAEFEARPASQAAQVMDAGRK